MPSYKLVKSQRIKRHSDFERFRLPSTRSVYAGDFILKAFTRPQSDLLNDAPQPRIGIITSKKIGNAPKRNHVRRIIRETFRLNQEAFQGTHDYLFITLPAISTKSNKEIFDAILSALKQKKLSQMLQSAVLC